jgi:hypothetical protein
MIMTTVLVAGGTLISVAFNPFASGKRATLASDLNNVRQITLALYGFATNFDGQFPNSDTGEKVVKGGTGAGFSNDYFRQLFLSSEIDSELIFWVQGASVCSAEKPDDRVAEGGKPVAKEILKAGDCGWAYMTEQTNTSNLARPLLLSAYTNGKKEFDKKLYDGKVIVMRIDGSAKPIKLDAQRHLDSNGEDLLSPKAKPWAGSGEDPAKLLTQPNPVPAKKAAVELPNEPAKAPR